MLKSHRGRIGENIAEHRSFYRGTSRFSILGGKSWTELCLNPFDRADKSNSQEQSRANMAIPEGFLLMLHLLERNASKILPFAHAGIGSAILHIFTWSNNVGIAMS